MVSDTFRFGRGEKIRDEGIESLVGGRGGTRHPTLLVNLLGSVASGISLLREVHAAEEVLACTAQDPMLSTVQPMGTIWAQYSL